MRRLAVMFFAVLSLVAVILGGVAAVHAIAHPVSCPGAFIGCPQNGEEQCYDFGYLADLSACNAGVLMLMGPWLQHGPLWRNMVFVACGAVGILFPMPIGLVVSIILSTVLPGFGGLLYLLVLVFADVTFLIIVSIRMPPRLHISKQLSPITTNEKARFSHGYSSFR